MNLVISIGSSNTKVGICSDHDGEHLQIMKIPAYISLPAYRPGVTHPPETGGAGTLHHLLLTGSSSARMEGHTAEEILQQYLAALRQEYTGGEIDSVALSVPNYFGMWARRTMLAATRQATGSDQVHLLPEPLAALLGYHTVTSPHPLRGNLLVINLTEPRVDFSLVTVSASQNRMCLELQVPLDLTRRTIPSSLPPFIEQTLLPKAKDLGFYSHGRWDLQAILLLEEPDADTTLPTQLSLLFPGVQLCRGGEEPLLQGLAYWSQRPDQRPQMQILYPFRFWIEMISEESPDPYRIPLAFDTANLAFDIEREYSLAALFRDGYPLQQADGKIKKYRILEVPQDLNPEGMANPGIICSDWRSPPLDRHLLEICFNVREYLIEAGPPRHLTQESLRYTPSSDIIRSSRRLLSVPFLHPALKEDLERMVKNQDQHEPEDPWQLTRLRLLALLQILGSS